jgi:hypothetical protein
MSVLCYRIGIPTVTTIQISETQSWEFPYEFIEGYGRRSWVFKKIKCFFIIFHFREKGIPPLLVAPARTAYSTV